MRKISLLFILIAQGCISHKSVENKSVMCNLATDFPKTDTLISWEKKSSLSIIGDVVPVYIDESVIFIYNKSNDNFGHCYDLNDGKVISTLVGRGKAANEMNSISYLGNLIYGDSIQFADYQSRKINIFSIEDILTKPLGERNFSVVNIPDSISTLYFKKTNADQIFGTLNFNEIGNNNRYFAYEKGVTTYFGELNEELFEAGVQFWEVGMAGIFNMSMMASYGDKIVTANHYGLLLNVIDLNKKEIIHERYYDKIVKDKMLVTDYKTLAISCDSKRIYCIISDKKVKDEYSLLVYDWTLKPIKKYSIRDRKRLLLSHDCKTLYSMVESENGWSLCSVRLQE